MPNGVHCEVCGKLLSSRHLNSHKRLAHGKGQVPGLFKGSDAIDKILDLYQKLSAEDKKRLLARLQSLPLQPSESSVS